MRLPIWAVEFAWTQLPFCHLQSMTSLGMWEGLSGFSLFLQKLSFLLGKTSPTSCCSGEVDHYLESYSL